MAITRAQIARELYIKGGVVNPDGRRGFGGGATMGESDRGYQGGGRDKEGNVSGDAPGGATGDPGGNDNQPTSTKPQAPPSIFNKLKGQPSILSKPKVPPPKPKAKPKKTKFSLSNIFQNYFRNNLLGKTINAISNTDLAYGLNAIQREKFLEKLQEDDPERYAEVMKDLTAMGYVTSGVGPIDTKMGLNPTFKDLGEPQAKAILEGGRKVNVNPDDINDYDLSTDYTDYLNRFNTTDTGGGGDGINNIPIPPLVGETVDNRTELEKLLDARGPAYRFFADGGVAREGYQQGGIMPRLNQLSGSVSSAEQMLQEINQKLESAESSLGSGDGGSIMPENNNFTNPTLEAFKLESDKPLGMRPGNIPGTDAPFSSLKNSVFRDPVTGGGQPMSQTPSPFKFRQEGDMARYVADNDPGMQFEGYSSYQDYLGAGNDPVPIPQGLQPLRAAFAEGGMPYEGGIMDLESARQMYGLGKLVKKATRAVKKIAKSPIGKAALLYAGGTYLGGLSSLGGSGTFMSNLKSGKGIANLLNFGKTKLGFDSIMKQGAKQTTKGLLSSPFGLIAGASVLPFLFQGDEEEQQQYLGPDIDIPAIRRDPYKYMGEAYRFAADGGLMRKGYASGTIPSFREYLEKEGLNLDELDANIFNIMQKAYDRDYPDRPNKLAEGGKAEPVAKKTMPLLDMDGQEMDFRAEGGFVPIGRMERADDVPARLSKNEFVFTADAVRNAGEGDIDKGAEVMYNMMKNLESGGEVSEESQGLDGAREMFKTSQRLGEVV